MHLLAISLMYGTLAMGFDICRFYQCCQLGICGYDGVRAYTSALLLLNLVLPMDQDIVGHYLPH